MAKSSPAARTPEEYENLLINKAYKLVEKRLDEETASSQETTHFLKMGSSRARIEEERLREEVKHLKAKTETLAQAGEIKELVKDALDAIRGYQGAEVQIEETYDF